LQIRKRLVVVLFGKKLLENFSDSGGQLRWLAADGGSGSQRHKVVVNGEKTRKLQQ